MAQERPPSSHSRRPRQAKAAAKPVRRRLSADERRQQIVATAQRMFIAAGRDSVSMQSIADEAGVNVSLLYQHFRSNVELYEAAVIQPLHQLLSEVATAGRDDWPSVAEERLVRVHETLLELVRRAGPLLGIALFSDGNTGRAFYRNQIVPFVEGFVGEMLAEVASAGGLDLDLRATAVATFGIHLTFVMYPNMPPADFDVGDVARRMAALQWAGVAGAAGNGSS